MATSPPSTAPTSRVEHRPALALLLFASTLGVMGGAMVSPVLEIIRGDLGVSGTAAGLIITTHGLTIAVTSPLVGWAIDRWGVRLPMAAGLLLYGLGGGAGLVTGSSYPALLASRVVFGAGAAIVFIGTTVAVLALWRGSVRDRVMGWRTTATTAGGVVWPLIGGALGGISWHATFGLYLVGIPVALVTLVLMPDVREQQAPAKGGLVDLVRSSPRILAVYGLLFTMMAMLYSLAVFLPQRLAEVGVEQPVLVSMFTASMSATASLAGFAYAPARRRWSYSALLRFAFACWAVAYLILGTVDHAATIMVATVLFGLGQAMAFSSLTSLLGDFAPVALLGRATSISGTVVFLGQFVSPLLIGPIVDAASLSTAYLVVAGVALVLLAVLSVTRVSPPSGEPPVEEPIATAS